MTDRIVAKDGTKTGSTIRFVPLPSLSVVWTEKRLLSISPLPYPQIRRDFIAPVVCLKEVSLVVQAAEDQFRGDFSHTSRQYQRLHYGGNCLCSCIYS